MSASFGRHTVTRRQIFSVRELLVDQRPWWTRVLGLWPARRCGASHRREWGTSSVASLL